MRNRLKTPEKPPKAEEATRAWKTVRRVRELADTPRIDTDEDLFPSFDKTPDTPTDAELLARLADATTVLAYAGRVWEDAYGELVRRDTPIKTIARSAGVTPSAVRFKRDPDMRPRTLQPAGGSRLVGSRRGQGA